MPPGYDHTASFNSNTPPTASIGQSWTSLSAARDGLKTLLQNKLSGTFDFATPAREPVGTKQFTMTSKVGSGISNISVVSNTFESFELTITTTSLNDADNTHFDSRDGFNPCYTPPYYYGQCWVDMIFKPKETKKYTISEIINETTSSAIRFDSQVFSSSYSDFNFGPFRS